MNRMTYGDTIAAACLEITCREILAQKCMTALARDILLNQRYVDDTTGGDEQKEKLLEALLDIYEVLESHCFSFKKVFTNHLFHKDLNPDVSSIDGEFTSDDHSESFFHHTWFFRSDMLANLPLLNPFKKIRGCYTGAYLQDCDISSLYVTKTLISRLAGQCYSLDGSFLSPLSPVFKSLFPGVNMDCSN